MTIQLVGQVAPLSIARLLTAASSQPPRLEFIAGPLAHPVAAIEFAQLDPEPGVLQRMLLDTSRLWQRTSISESGAATASADEGSGPMVISGPCRVMLPITPGPNWPSLNCIEIRLLAADGQILERLRFPNQLFPLPVTTDQKAGADQ